MSFNQQVRLSIFLIVSLLSACLSAFSVNNVCVFAYYYLGILFIFIICATVRLPLFWIKRLLIVSLPIDYLSIYLLVCVPIRLSVFLFVRLYASLCLFASPLTVIVHQMSACLSVCRSAYLFTCLLNVLRNICPPVCLSQPVCQSVCLLLSACLFVCQSACLFILLSPNLSVDWMSVSMFACSSVYRSLCFPVNLATDCSVCMSVLMTHCTSLSVRLCLVMVGYQQLIC